MVGNCSTLRHPSSRGAGPLLSSHEPTMVAPPSALFGGWALGLGLPHGFRRCFRFRITPLQFHSLPLIEPHWPCCSQNVRPRTTPAPLFGSQYQAALHRVAVHVADFLLDLGLTPHHKVVKSPLPDVLRL